MNELSITYKRTKEDVLKHTTWHRMFKNKLIMVLNVVFPIIGVVAGFTIFTVDPTPIQYIAVMYLIMYPFITYGFIKMRINSLFKNPEVMFYDTTFIFSETGILITGQEGEINKEWTSLYGVYETKGYLYFYVNKQNSFLVNKEFIGESKTVQLKELVKRYADANVLKFK